MIQCHSLQSERNLVAEQEVTLMYVFLKSNFNQLRSALIHLVARLFLFPSSLSIFSSFIIQVIII